MNCNQTIRKVILWTLAVGIVAAPALAAPAPAKEVSVFADTGSISFAPNGGYSYAELTVRLREGGIVYHRGFTARGALRYDLVEDTGARLSDGRYVYELRFSGAGGREHAISGRFEIRSGSLVSAETIEVDVKQELTDVPILGDAIVAGSVCVSDSEDCLVDLIILESESFDTPGFGAADIKIKDNVPEIWFADTTELDSDFAITVEDSLFFVRDPDADTLPFVIEGGAPTNSVYLTQPGGVGIGTPATDADIHVANLDGIGDTVFKLQVLGQGSWNIGMVTNGVFAFNKSGTGDREFTVRELDHPVATLDVHGHVRGTSFKSSSSRTLKTGFQTVDPVEVLAKVSELPVTSWRYKSESEKVTHLGPVAEDFRRLFGLGDGKTISGIDADGVALAAIQGLKRELEEKDRQIADLAARLAGLEAKMAADAR